ncbi:MAG: hypothetical protein K0S55_136 [Clostridia bacterium]|nr:hypothetical protein [Clostridia bacterium]
MYADKYIEDLQNILKNIRQTQMPNIRKAAEAIVKATQNKNKIYAVGSGHAGLLAQELFYRSGGLVVINPIFAPGLTLEARPITITTDIERIEGYGKSIIKRKEISEGDVIIIHSVSGRNAVSVDMALEAKEKGAVVIVLTNLSYSKSVSSRHSSGKRLFEVCDILLDNCGIAGDAAIKVEDFPEKTGPTSTAAGAAILNAVVVEAVAIFIEKGVTPPVFMSANLEGGDEHNKKVLNEYKDIIFYM